MAFFSETKALLQLSFKQTFAYRVHMVFSVFFGPVIIFLNYVVWKAVYAASSQSTFGGLTFEHMVTYVVIAHATGYLLWDDVHDDLMNRIHNGTLTPLLIRPLTYQRYKFIEKIGHRFLAFMIEFLPILFITGLLFGFDVYSTSHFWFYAAVIPLSFTITHLLYMLVGMTAFWLVRPRGVIWAYNVLSRFLYGGFLPLTLFPPLVQKIFFFLPFQFLGFVPASLYLGSYELGGFSLTPLQVLGYGVLHVVFLFILVKLVWYCAIRRFCGVGQ